MEFSIGEVVDIDDPEGLGRVKIQEIGSNIPVEKLLWTMPAMPVTSATINGIGQTPQLLKGSRVLQAYLTDNVPVALASIPFRKALPEGFEQGKNSVTVSPDGHKTTIDKSGISIETESGHVITYNKDGINFKTSFGDAVSYLKDGLKLRSKDGGYLDILGNIPNLGNKDIKMSLGKAFDFNADTLMPRSIIDGFTVDLGFLQKVESAVKSFNQIKGKFTNQFFDSVDNFDNMYDSQSDTLTVSNIQATNMEIDGGNF